MALDNTVNMDLALTALSELFINAAKTHTKHTLYICMTHALCSPITGWAVTQTPLSHSLLCSLCVHYLPA